MIWYLTALKKYADFNGRARRKEYWMYTLFNIIFSFIAIILDHTFDIAFRGIGYGPLYCIYALIFLIPGLAVSTRRLHDIGKSGWMLLIALIPIIGSFWLLILLTTDSHPTENEYGSNPKNNLEGEAITTEYSNEKIIFLVIIWLLATQLFWAIIPKVFENYYSLNWFNHLSTLLSLVWAIIPIGLTFSIKGKTKQLVLFILSGLYFVHSLYEILMRLI